MVNGKREIDKSGELFLSNLTISFRPRFSEAKAPLKRLGQDAR
jgi:hypothetical protein